MRALKKGPTHSAAARTMPLINPLGSCIFLSRTPMRVSLMSQFLKSQYH